jgi:hypothetical protein
VEVDIQQPYALASPCSVFPLGRSQATAQVVPPAVLEFRKWLAIWSGESAKLQDANEKELCTAVLGDGLNGAYARKPKPEIQEQKGAARRAIRISLVLAPWKVGEATQPKSLSRLASPQSNVRHTRRTRSGRLPTHPLAENCHRLAALGNPHILFH